MSNRAKDGSLNTTVEFESSGSFYWATIKSCNEEIGLESRISREDIEEQVAVYLRDCPTRRSVTYIEKE
jgi:hypothetical protein